MGAPVSHTAASATNPKRVSKAPPISRVENGASAVVGRQAGGSAGCRARRVAWSSISVAPAQLPLRALISLGAVASKRGKKRSLTSVGVS